MNSGDKKVVSTVASNIDACSKLANRIGKANQPSWRAMEPSVKFFKPGHAAAYARPAPPRQALARAHQRVRLALHPESAADLPAAVQYPSLPASPSTARQKDRKSVV